MIVLFTRFPGLACKIKTLRGLILRRRSHEVRWQLQSRILLALYYYRCWLDTKMNKAPFPKHVSQTHHSEQMVATKITSAFCSNWSRVLLLTTTQCASERVYITGLVCSPLSGLPARASLQIGSRRSSPGAPCESHLKHWVQQLYRWGGNPQ